MLHLIKYMTENLLYRIIVKGRVQGVGFRWNAAKEARLRGIKGYVKNLPGGEVLIEVEGTRDILDDYVKWCNEGPAFSVVESVDVETLSPRGYDDFRIEH
jgi:acylphosphatase